MSHILFSTRSSLILAEKIASSYDEALGTICFLEFKDGEYEPYFDESIRGANVFIIGGTFPPSDNLMELLLICDAAKRSSAYNITLLMPYYGWGRQDRKEKLRGSIGAKLVANLIVAAGASRVIVMDLHTNQIQGFFDIPVDHIYASNIFIGYLQLMKSKRKNLTIASTDLGGAKRAKSYASYLETDVIICYKERKKANEIENMNCIGEVKNKNVIFIDDMVDTAGTLVIAANFIKKGACSVRALSTHPVLSENANEKIETSFLDELVVTDSIPFKNKLSSKIKVLSCATIFSDVIHLVHNKESLSKYFFI
ncbi:ribose-phosphate pyrophosphokinase [Candidatus Uzinura diaspidicola str. ASNER]|uniref:ribose-phosphate diphosphokinase n=1 Tax=Candidatus Uzinura diaspidicola str. ASNER TaxID=1133592 RepID=L7VK44_9FLAO|nr:ribose-phosphate pyrophosphokinase [Candidatus Uzinura diaspidicola str. ASNER]